MRDFLRDNSIFASEQDAYLLIRTYDSNNDGRLSFAEFKQLTLPSTSSALASIAIGRPSYVVGYYDRLPYSTETALAHLFEAEVELHRHVEALKRDLALRYDFSPRDCFAAEDWGAARPACARARPTTCPADTTIPTIRPAHPTLPTTCAALLLGSTPPQCAPCAPLRPRCSRPRATGLLFATNLKRRSTARLRAPALLPRPTARRASLR